MSGNTKLIGFLGMVKNPLTGQLVHATGIQLERWGQKVEVSLDKKSTDTIREACASRLPRTPPPRAGDTSFGASRFTVEYDHQTGWGILGLGVESLKALKLLCQNRIEYTKTQPGYGYSPPDVVLDERKKLESWIQALDEVIQAHEEYTKPDEESGIKEPSNTP